MPFTEEIRRRVSLTSPRRVSEAWPSIVTGQLKEACTLALRKATERGYGDTADRVIPQLFIDHRRAIGRRTIASVTCAGSPDMSA